MQSNTQIQVLREQLRDFAPNAIEELKRIILSGRATPKTKLDAIQLLFDRVGLPAVRASISQNVSGGNEDLGSLLENKERIMLEASKVAEELREVEVKLGKNRKA